MEHNKELICQHGWLSVQAAPVHPVIYRDTGDTNVPVAHPQGGTFQLWPGLCVCTSAAPAYWPLRWGGVGGNGLWPLSPLALVPAQQVGKQWPKLLLGIKTEETAPVGWRVTKDFIARRSSPGLSSKWDSFASKWEKKLAPSGGIQILVPYQLLRRVRWIFSQ